MPKPTNKPFSEIAFEFSRAREEFESKIYGAGQKKFDFLKIGWDEYDNSLEIYEVPADHRLNEDQQVIIRDAGFSKCYVNHTDGWETHYNFGPNVSFPYRGWRRLQREGGFDVNYYPESWKGLNWLETGYIKVVDND